MLLLGLASGARLQEGHHRPHPCRRRSLPTDSSPVLLPRRLKYPLVPFPHLGKSKATRSAMTNTGHWAWESNQVAAHTMDASHPNANYWDWEEKTEQHPFQALLEYEAVRQIHRTSRTTNGHGRNTMVTNTGKHPKIGSPSNNQPNY
jgi:hypothetical protein